MQKGIWAPVLLLVVLYLPFLLFVEGRWRSGELTAGAFARVFEDGRALSIFAQSLGLAAYASIISMAAGGLVAAVAAKSALRFSRYLIFLFLLPLALPGFVYVEAVLVLSELFSTNLFTPTVLVIVLAVAYMPVSAAILYGGFRAIPRALEESAQLAGPGNSWFKRITIPWMTPYLAGAFIVTFLFAFSSYEIPSLMSVRTYTLYIFNQFAAFYSYADAICLLTPVVALYALLIALTILILRHRPFFSFSANTKTVRLRLAKGASFGLMAVLTVLGILCAMPLTILLVKAISIRSMESASSEYFREVGYSMLVSLSSGCIAVLLATMFTRSMLSATARKRALLWTLSLAPFAVPPALLSFGLIEFSTRVGDGGTVSSTLILIWGLAARYFPVVVQIVYAGALSVNPHLLDAALLAKRSRVRNLFGIWFPLNIGVMQKALLFFIVLSLSEVALAVLLVPPDCMTAAVNIYAMLHYGFGKEVALETLLLLAAVIPAILCVVLPYRRTAQHAARNGGAAG